MMQIVSYSENSATARAVNGGRAGCEMMLPRVPKEISVCVENVHAATL